MSDFVRCCVCYSDYDLQEHVAVVLSQCGHNVCQLCAEKLIESNKDCPICRKRFSTDEGTLYTPNRQIKEQLEKENQYERCPVHVRHLLEFYCQTDKCKICMECHFDKGKDGHRGHEVERIVDFQEQLESKRKIFEVRKAKFQAIYDEGKSLLGKRRQDELDNFKSVERISKLVVFETYLKVKTMFDEEESRLEEQYGEDSNLRREIESKVNQYGDLKKTDFNVVLEEDAERLAEKFDKPELIEYFEDLKSQTVMRNLSMPKITQNESKTQIESICISKTKLKSYLSFSIENETLTVTASDLLNKNVCVDIDRWEKEVKSINFVFDKFNFNHEDLLLLEYVWVKLQSQVHVVGLEYRNTSNSDSTIKFEDHLADFPRIIFTQPKNLKTIDLKFLKAKGSDRYTRSLSQKYLAEASNLTSLKLTFEDTDLTDNTFVDFLKHSKVLLKDLTVLSLIIKKTQIQNHLLTADSLILPNLKEFTFCTDVSCVSFIIDQGFLGTSLASMKQLTKCEIEIDRNDFFYGDLETFLEIFHRMPELGRLKVAIPSLEVPKAKYEEFCYYRLPKEPRELQLIVKVAEPRGGLFASNRNETYRTNPLDLLDIFENIPGRNTEELFWRAPENRASSGLFNGLTASQPAEPTGLFTGFPSAPNTRSLHSNPNPSRGLFAGLASSRPGEPRGLFSSNSNLTRAEILDRAINEAFSRNFEGEARRVFSDLNDSNNNL